MAESKQEERPPGKCKVALRDPSDGLVFINNTNPRELSFTQDSLGEASTAAQSKITACLIKESFVLEDATVTELGSGIGSNTVEFAREGFNVNAVERDPTTAGCLRGNIAATQQGAQVQVHEGNALCIVGSLTQSALFIDAPWGGPQYKRSRHVAIGYEVTPSEYEKFTGGPSPDASKDEKIFVGVPFVIRTLRDTAQLFIVKAPMNINEELYQVEKMGFSPDYGFSRVVFRDKKRRPIYQLRFYYPRSILKRRLPQDLEVRRCGYKALRFTRVE